MSPTKRSHAEISSSSAVGRVVSFNVNGLRGAMRSGHRVCTGGQVRAERALRRTLQVRSVLLSQILVRPNNWDAYYSLSPMAGGYSGVATFCRQHSFSAVEAKAGVLWILDQIISRISSGATDANDANGDDIESVRRVLNLIKLFEATADGPKGVVLERCLRCLAAGESDAVLHTLLALREYAKKIKTFPSAMFNDIATGRELEVPVIILGDFNVQLSPDDSCDPEAWEWKKESLSYINQMKAMVEDTDMVDSFRHFHPGEKDAFTCWNQVTGARLTNFGSRIDMIFLSSSLLQERRIIAADIHQSCHVSHCETKILVPQGSDHCPISVTIAHDVSKLFHGSQLPPPSLCAAHMPQATLRQSSLLPILNNVESLTPDCSNILTSNILTPEVYCIVLLPKKRVEDVNPDALSFMSKSSQPVRVIAQAISSPEVTSHSVVHLFWTNSTVLLSACPANINELPTAVLLKAIPARIFRAINSFCPPLPGEFQCPKSLLTSGKNMSNLKMFMPSDDICPTGSGQVSDEEDKTALREGPPSLATAVSQLLDICACLSQRAICSCSALITHRSILEQLPSAGNVEEIQSGIYLISCIAAEVEDTISEVPNVGKSPNNATDNASGSSVKDLLHRVRFLSEKEQQRYLESVDRAPRCVGHKLPCVERKVKKAGSTFGKAFWSCVLPDAKKGDPNGRCNTFQWVHLGPTKRPSWAVEKTTTSL